MFIQVIQAKSTRRDEVRALMDEWSELPNEGYGFLGGTYGFTDDDEFIGVVRFESKEKAMANSARPETDAMAQRMAALMARCACTDACSPSPYDSNVAWKGSMSRRPRFCTSGSSTLAAAPRAALRPRCARRYSR